MPAIWMLNARIPLTAQYHPCSCWSTGCGEFDIFEVLSPGDTKAKSTVHATDGKSGGDSNFFERPVGDFIRVAVVFDGDSGTVQVKVLADGKGKGEFRGALGGDEVRMLMRDEGGSVFPLGS